MNKKIFIFCFILSVFSSICFSQEQTDHAKYILYLPKGMETSKAYPLVMALSPSADAQSMINVWKPIADKYKWIIMASKESKNGMDMHQGLKDLARSLEGVCRQFSVDQSKIIITGFSGGAMCSHAFSYTYPEMFSAIILNTGMMHEYYFDKRSSYPRHKVAVFLASPTDFRYNEMKRDKTFLDSLGWVTKWIEFQGGHALAPQAAYLEAANWVNEEWQAAEKIKNAPVVSRSKNNGRFKVDGIIFNPQGKSSAIVNGEILQEGDRFKGVLIARIRKNSVDVIIDGEVMTLRLE
jgi:predicted esterase